MMLSCGHIVNADDEIYHIIYPEVSRHGQKALAYASVCHECNDTYRTRGESFETNEEAMSWYNEPW